MINITKADLLISSHHLTHLLILGGGAMGYGIQQYNICSFVVEPMGVLTSC